LGIEFVLPHWLTHSNCSVATDQRDQSQ